MRDPFLAEYMMAQHEMAYLILMLMLLMVEQSGQAWV